MFLENHLANQTSSFFGHSKLRVQYALGNSNWIGLYNPHICILFLSLVWNFSDGYLYFLCYTVRFLLHCEGLNPSWNRAVNKHEVISDQPSCQGGHPHCCCVQPQNPGTLPICASQRNRRWSHLTLPLRKSLHVWGPHCKMEHKGPLFTWSFTFQFPWPITVQKYYVENSRNKRFVSFKLWLSWEVRWNLPSSTWDTS